MLALILTNALFRGLQKGNKTTRNMGATITFSSNLKIFLSFIFFLAFASEYFICMYCFVLHMCLVSMEAMRRYQISRTGVINSCELHHGDWKLNPGSLTKWLMLLITKPSLHPHWLFLKASLYRKLVGNEIFLSWTRWKRYSSISFVFCIFQLGL